MRFFESDNRKTRREGITKVAIRNLYNQESTIEIVEGRALQQFGQVMSKDEEKPKLITKAYPDGGRGKARGRLERNK